MNWPPGKRFSRAPVAYLVLAAIATLASARLFYGYMLQQTQGEWSAPLDDVFIHFDYARATARGFPFQWSEGNGFSSGNTSLLYPFILAFGYWVGFRGPEQMVWAAIVACCSVFGLLWSAHGLFRRLPAWTSPLAIVATFSIGALCWSFWSGMEVALYMGVWAIGLAIAQAFENRSSSITQLGWALGGAGALIVLVRPEGATTIALLGLFAAFSALKHHGPLGAAGTLVRAGIPAGVVLLAQNLANKHFTGESAANGALVKLALHNPFMTPDEKLDHWLFNLRYCFDRLTLHHFGEMWPWGYVPVVLGLVPFFDARTRRYAALLWASILSWVLLVSLNGQVRWQNERYLMPAVSWLMLSVTLGVAVLIAPVASRKPWRPARLAAGVLAACVLLGGFWRAERVQYRDQVWFFARASRNIRDQQTTAGRLLRKLDPLPRRVLVGDAGAILYASDLPGFDIIGLGGYHDLPIARSSVQGVAATLELIERLPPAERPDIMAIFPTWWPTLMHWFGRELTSVPVRGNVICGGAEKAILQADWSLLGTGNAPRSLLAIERVVGEVDVADLISERAAGYVFPRPQGGWTDMRVLPDPKAPQRDLWDAGRRIPLDRTETFVLRDLPRSGSVRLVIRTIIDRASSIEVQLGSHTSSIELEPTSGWSEVSIDVPAAQLSASGELPVSITPRKGEWVNYHIWAVALD